MEEENVPHSDEDIDFQTQGERLEQLVHNNNSSDADESTELVENESDDGNDQRIVDFAMQRQNYFALGRCDNEDNDPETIDQIDHSSSLYNSPDLANDVFFVFFLFCFFSRMQQCKWVCLGNGKRSCPSFRWKYIVSDVGGKTRKAWCSWKQRGRWGKKSWWKWTWKHWPSRLEASSTNSCKFVIMKIMRKEIEKTRTKNTF